MIDPDALGACPEILGAQQGKDECIPKNISSLGSQAQGTYRIYYQVSIMNVV
jgi:hypothetical protein